VVSKTFIICNGAGIGEGGIRSQKGVPAKWTNRFFMNRMGILAPLEKGEKELIE